MSNFEIEIDLDGVRLQVRGRWSPGDPEIWSGSPDRWSPPEGPEVLVDSVVDEEGAPVVLDEDAAERLVDAVADLLEEQAAQHEDWERAQREEQEALYWREREALEELNNWRAGGWE